MTGTVKTNGVDTAYRFDGPEKGRVVLMSNSLMSNYTMWDCTVPALADKYRVLRYDFRGHGASDVTPGSYSFDRMGRDVVELLDSLAIDKVTFCGISFGGLITIRFAARHAAAEHVFQT